MSLFVEGKFFKEAGANGGGGGGSDPHNLGYYADLTALQTAHPTASDGDFAILGSTDTIWVWDSGTSAWKDTDQKGQVESVNGQTGQVNIKSVNGNSLMGSGDIKLSTYLTYPNGWTTSGTTKAFCDAVAADTTATKGKAYLGEVTFSDLPASMVNAEVIVEIIDGTTAQNKVIVLTCTSGNTAPYKWQYTYWNGGTDVSGWKTWATAEQGAKADTSAQQYPVMPTASASNLGDIVQYIGATVEPAEESAVIEQTVGSGLYDLYVDVDVFEGVAQLADGGTMDFVAHDTSSATYVTVTGNISFASPGSAFLLMKNMIDPSYPVESNYSFTYAGSNQWSIKVVMGGWESPAIGTLSTSNLESCGITITGTPQVDDKVRGNINTECSFETTVGNMTVTSSAANFQDIGARGNNGIQLVCKSTDGYAPQWGVTELGEGGGSDLGDFYDDELEAYGIIIDYNGQGVEVDDTVIGSVVPQSGAIEWQVNNETVNISNYGISYNGSPNNGDTLEVTYNAAKVGITKGFFYESTSEYSSPFATISQTTGSGLYNLAVDVNTYVEYRQPTANENLAFVAETYPEEVSYITHTGNTTFSSNTSAYYDICEALSNPDYFGLTFTYNGSSWDVSNVYQANLGDLSSFELEGYGITITGTPQQDDYIEATIIDGGCNWLCNNEYVNLQNYGISVDGYPNNGDVLTVDYLAPVVIGYHWQQIDVQSGSGSDGDEIEWAASADFLPEYQEGNYRTFKYSVENLPDGKYEFYWQRLANVSNGMAPLAKATFKYEFELSTDEYQNRQCDANAYLVYDGETALTADEYTMLQSNNLINYNLICVENGGTNLIIGTASTCWYTAIGTTGQNIEGAHKISVIKNVITGQKYYPEFWEFSNTYYNAMSGYTVMNRAFPAGYHYASSNFSAGTLYGFGQTYGIKISFAGINNNKALSSKLEIRVSSPNGKYFADVLFNGTDMSYAVVDEKEVTGIFMDAKLGYNNSDPSALSLIFKNATNLGYPIMSSVARIGTNDADTDEYAAPYLATSSQTSASYTTFIDLPTTSRIVGRLVSNDYVGGIAEYDGTTTQNYENGYFYKSALLAQSELTATCIRGSLTDILVDNNRFNQETNGKAGWYLFAYKNGSWTRGDFEADLTTYGISYTGTPSSNDMILVESKVADWNRIDVQPTAKISTAITLAAADWSGGSQTITVSGMTTTAVVIVAPAPASQADYTAAGILCTAQATDSLTFTASTTPTNDLTVNVIAM